MSRKWLFRLAAITCGSLIAILLVEIGVRAAGLDSPLVWTPDPELGWKHVPGAETQWTEEGNGHIVINSLGHRDRERSESKRPGVFRIGIFGDSMTEGVQVNLPETYAYRLQELLSSPSRPIEVFNFGVNGYSPQQELLQFRREGPRNHLDLVILATFLDNDVADTHPDLRSSDTGSPYASVLNGGLHWDLSRAEQSYASYHAQPICSLRQNSALYRFLSGRLHKMSKSRTAASQAGTAIPRRFLLYQVPPPEKWDDAWKRIEKIVQEFASESQRQGSQFLWLSVPAGQVVNPKAWESVQNSNAAMASVAWDLTQPERQFTEIARRLNVTAIQPVDRFKQANQEPQLFFGNVGHFTARGHEVMAQAIAQFLNDQNLLPTIRKVASVSP